MHAPHHLFNALDDIKPRLIRSLGVMSTRQDPLHCRDLAGAKQPPLRLQSPDVSIAA
jgi:hypothetical protein